MIIAGAALFLYSDRLFKAGLLEGSNIAPLVAVIAVGVCVGFLPHNFSPARIFMGDAGAMFLGLLLATTTITVGGRTADQFSGQTYFFFAPLFIPIVILGVPILDTAFSFVRRVVQRQSFAQADREHLHHRLMRLGPRPAARGRDPVALDRAALGGRAAADVHQPRQRARPARRWSRSASSSTSTSIPGVRSRRGADGRHGIRRGRGGHRRRWRRGRGARPAPGGAGQLDRIRRRAEPRAFAPS